MARMIPEAVLFDMDGLLVDSEPLWFRVERAFAAARGLDWTDALAAACVGRGIPATLAYMESALGLSVELEAGRAEIIDRFIAGVSELSLKPGAERFLRAAQGRVPVGLASSSPMRLVRAVLKRFELEPRFSAVVSGEMVERPKPAPDIFLYAARELGAAPGRTVVLEDSLAGAQAGRAAGMYVIVVPDAAHALPPLAGVADAVVRDLHEALERVELPAATVRPSSA